MSKKINLYKCYAILLASIVLVCNARDSQEECMICLEHFKSNNVNKYHKDYDKYKELVTTACGHKAHLNCISTWLNEGRVDIDTSCCMCRGNPIPLSRESGTQRHEDSIYCETEGMMACRLGNSVKLQLFLREDPSLVNQDLTEDDCMNGRYTFLQIASLNGRDNCVKVMIEAGENVNEKDMRGYNCLQLAISKYSKKTNTEIMAVMDTFVKAGVDVNHVANNGMNCLHMICDSFRTKKFELIEKLIEYEVDVNQTTDTGETCLHLAAKNKDIRTINLLIEAGVDVNKTSDTGETCIHIATANGSVDIVDVLIKAGANTELVRWSDNETALSIAVSLGHDGCSDVLREAISVIPPVLQKAKINSLCLYFINKLWGSFFKFMSYIK